MPKDNGLIVNDRRNETYRLQVKVCGLTDVDTAASCADLGVNAIGCVFYPKSPRFVSDRRAREIRAALPPSVQTVGVFVDNTFSHIMQKVETCGLTAVQLHGQESPALLRRLKDENLLVIKALFVERSPRLIAAKEFQEAAFLVEHGKGALPGGNAAQWDWGTIHRFGQEYPLILAGGLTPDNITEAIASCEPDAVDVSSGVESAPGIKDLGKVEAFLNAISRCSTYQRSPRSIF